MQVGREETSPREARLRHRGRGVWPGISAGVWALLCLGCATPYDCADCSPPRSCCCSYHACTDNLVTKLTAAECARRDLKELERSSGKLSRHFHAGFREAYRDLALGRLAQIPPVPPSKYWTAYYRSERGQADVDDWFAGYQAGLEWGQTSGVSRFHRVASSGWSSYGASWDSVPAGAYPVVGAQGAPADGSSLSPASWRY